MEQDQWHWQEPGTAWRGVCVYHITLTVPSREPLLGRLVIPDGDPSQARVERTALGNAVIDEMNKKVEKLRDELNLMKEKIKTMA